MFAMQLLHTSEFLNIEFDDSLKMFKLTWKEKTASMSQDEFKEVMQIFASEFHRQSKSVLHLMQEMYFVIPPDLQIWIDENLNKKALMYGAEKAAFVVSPDIFTQVSVEQVMEEINAKKLSTAYFANEEDALKWLKPRN